MAAGPQIDTRIDTVRPAERLDESPTKHAPNYRRELRRVVVREVLRRSICIHPHHTAERIPTGVKQNLRNPVSNL